MLALKSLYFGLMLAGCVQTSSWSVRMSNVLKGNHLPVNLAVKENLGTGLKLAVSHCQRQFKWDPWNCPANVFSHGNRGWGSTKEFAYVAAITSAAVTYVITRNCSLGHIKGCGCNPNLNGQTEENFIWGECSDYPEYGEDITKKFLDDAETGVDAHTYANLHNYGVGRDVVRKSMKKHCKCHGMSGSCTIQSCWMQMAPFEEIASQLRVRYDKAVRFDFEGDGRFAVGNSVSGNRIDEFPRAYTKNLLYVQKSPNYCRENNTTGWRGTKGRVCSRRREEGVTGPERKSCLNLCRRCGHDVRKKEQMVERNCNCSFKWCCEVKCERCRESVTEHFCS
ncbi:hypothetical protein RUM43_003700 [Polyplax serrata]|uniref:Protein Wnt n=1 Tax=Polyplax serrata TaxID=468196 RepID=A0AAN8NVV3_POLSC